MNFEQLEYVITIARLGNLTKSAEKLFLSQSALTKSMNRLEEELGVKLFDRLSSPIRLTSAGEYFVSEAEKLLRQKEQMERKLLDFSDLKCGKINVGMGPGRSEYWLPHILSEFWKEYPGIEVNVVTGGMSFLEQELLEHRLDLCFLSVPQFSLEQLVYDLVGQERLLLTISPEHPVLRGKCIPEDSFSHPLLLSPDELNGQRFLTAPPKHGATLLLHDLLNRYSVVPSGFTAFTSIDLAYALSAEGLGIAYVFEACARYPGYYKRPVFCTLGEAPETSSIMAAVRKEEEASPLIKVFVQITKDVVKNSKYLNPFSES